MIRVYVSHPYGGKIKNKLAVQEKIELLYKACPCNNYISPIHLYGYRYDKLPYAVGMLYCIDELRTCDKMIVCGDYKDSRGCLEEIMYAKNHNIPIEYEGGE